MDSTGGSGSDFKPQLLAEKTKKQKTRHNGILKLFIVKYANTLNSCLLIIN